MNYMPITAVWEVTMGCNMRCKHCGSSCESSLPDELTTEEALKLCDDLGKLGFQWITLSGGEPTTRKDWDLIAKRLKENNIIPNIITNAWLLDESTVIKAKNAGINTIAISMDGLENTHDFIRKKGSFQRDMKAIDLIVQNGMGCSIITTINNVNIDELEELKKIFVEKKISAWQLQLGLPMGNMLKNKQLVAEPFHVDQVIDFAYKTMLEDKIKIHLADCMGYFNIKEVEVRKHTLKLEEYPWNGCGAGKSVVGILYNGDITACTSIRNKQFIAGNIRERSIKDIWEDPNSFTWNREMKKEKLEGLCGKCKYGERCHGGCTNSRLTHGGSIYAENKYCSYNFALSKAKNQFDSVEDSRQLYASSKKYIENGNFQLAELALSRALEIDSSNDEIDALYKYVNERLCLKEC
ncbi:radical SAM/SPASM domain-containing protein [Clostridium hydrogenum]|uniref:radical SAM/SPASM domain-containing protein n=1 Tax=Clostridium hydrogenum TaxID=2855764 RepID=UPI001F301B9A|nr:radical SAM protein [Clostridium hydrogenum]